MRDNSNIRRRRPAHSPESELFDGLPQCTFVGRVAFDMPGHIIRVNLSSGQRRGWDGRVTDGGAVADGTYRVQCAGQTVHAVGDIEQPVFGI